MATNLVNELKKEAVLRAKQAQMGMQSRDAAVLLSLMADVDPSEGEVTSVRSVYAIAAELSLSENQVQRAMTKLRDLGLIARKQEVRKAGESAYTSILPAAYAILGIDCGDLLLNDAQPLPREISEILCCQSIHVMKAVSTAWHAREPLPEHMLGDLRGSLFDRLKRLFDARVEELVEEQERAIDEAMELEELRAAGYDRVETADGPVVVNVKALEQSCPEQIQWSFVKDVLELMNARKKGLVTRANLRDRIAEAAYARAALPFVRDKAWADGVRLLARQMEVRWDKPRRIWPGWYSSVGRLIHTASGLSH